MLNQCIFRYHSSTHLAWFCMVSLAFSWFIVYSVKDRYLGMFFFVLMWFQELFSYPSIQKGSRDIGPEKESKRMPNTSITSSINKEKKIGSCDPNRRPICSLTRPCNILHGRVRLKTFLKWFFPTPASITLIELVIHIVTLTI